MKTDEPKFPAGSVSITIKTPNDTEFKGKSTIEVTFDPTPTSVEDLKSGPKPPCFGMVLAMLEVFNMWSLGKLGDCAVSSVHFPQLNVTWDEEQIRENAVLSLLSTAASKISGLRIEDDEVEPTDEPEETKHDTPIKPTLH